MTRGLFLSPAHGDPTGFADLGQTSAALRGVPAAWVDGYQELLLRQWLAIRVPQGIRRKTDTAARKRLADGRLLSQERAEKAADAQRKP